MGATLWARVGHGDSRMIGRLGNIGFKHNAIAILKLNAGQLKFLRLEN